MMLTYRYDNGQWILTCPALPTFIRTFESGMAAVARASEEARAFIEGALINHFSQPTIIERNTTDAKRVTEEIAKEPTKEITANDTEDLTEEVREIQQNEDDDYRSRQDTQP
jgi:hypothetical protein